MKKGLVIAALAAVTIFTVAGRHFFSPPRNAANRHVDSPAGSSSELRIVPRKAPAISPQTPMPSAAHRTTYEQFKERKTCFDNAGTPSAIQQDIAELRAALPNYAGDLKVPFENEIRRKQTQLAILVKCGDAQTTQDELSRLLEKAAHEGDPGAQLKYAQDPLIDRSHSIENLDRLRAWRDTALGYVQSAANQGNSEAVLLLAEAYDPLHCQASNEPLYPGIYLAAIVSPDAETAYHYYYESKLDGDAPAWVDAELKTLEQYLTQAQIVVARQAAQSDSTKRP